MWDKKTKRLRVINKVSHVFIFLPHTMSHLAWYRASMAIVRSKIGNPLIICVKNTKGKIG